MWKVIARYTNNNRITHWVVEGNGREYIYIPKEAYDAITRHESELQYGKIELDEK